MAQKGLKSIAGELCHMKVSVHISGSLVSSFDNE